MGLIRSRPVSSAFSIDGGGVRRIVALAFLERLESVPAERRGGAGDFRLCRYFDLIGGTSTGAIVATALAMGYRAADLVEFYLNLAAKGFDHRRWHRGYGCGRFAGGH